MSRFYQALSASILLHSLVLLSLGESKSANASRIEVRVVAVQAVKGHEEKSAAASGLVNRGQSTRSAKKKSAGVSVAGESLGLKAQYPRLSRVLGESGQVLIEIRQDLVTLKKSSGFKRLDNSAVATVESALKTNALARSLEGRQAFLVHFIFRLTE